MAQETLDNRTTDREERRPPAIVAEGVRKWFPLRKGRRSSLTLLKNRILGRNEEPKQFFAVDGIDLTVQRGEKIGLIGNNGAGKTSLLKLLSGLYRPTSGTIRVRGDMTLLSGLGIGMLDELTLEQNVYLYGAIYGMHHEETCTRLPEILAWAGLEDFSGTMLKTLSKGMRTRLAFSITRHIKTDICLLDEALSGGDGTFREKCLEVLSSYRDSSRTYIVSSHNMDFVRHLCGRTLWLHHGKQMAFDETELVLEQYAEFNGTPAKS
jgi:ABC-2 type transport system ATP-binding protein